MFADTFVRRLLFNFAFIFVFLSIYITLFYPVYTSNEIMINFAVNPFNICERYPDTWEKLKLLYIPISSISTLIITNLIYSSLFTKKKQKQKTKSKSISSNNLSLFISKDKFVNKNAVKSISKSTNSKDLSIIAGKDENNNLVYIPEKSLYQNILITGTIGSGKTSSAMYPFTRQLVKYKYSDENLKLGMLILDVKGNYYSQVKKYVDYYRRQQDLIIIELRWKYQIQSFR